LNFKVDPASKATSAKLVFGWITDDAPLEIASQMPEVGVIFSDGVEEDFLRFNTGAIARIGLSEKQLQLFIPPRSKRRWSEPN
jgi:hypothetical protein